MKDSVDVLVIGSGIGGLCCAGLCAKSGRDVLVLEAHHQPGGAAHGFQRQGYHLESGPSLWSGLGRWPSNNPLAQVLRALGQSLEVVPYSAWDVLLPEGDLRVAVGNDGFEAVVGQLRGGAVVEEWRRFIDVLRPIAAAADALPLLSMRPGVGNLMLAGALGKMRSYFSSSSVIEKMNIFSGVALIIVGLCISLL